VSIQCSPNLVSIVVAHQIHLKIAEPDTAQFASVLASCLAKITFG